MKSAITCKNKYLKYYSIHDVFDVWRIILFDNDMNIVDANTLLSLKNELSSFLKSVSYKANNSFVKLPRSFDLGVEKGGIQTIDEYNFPAKGETFVEDVEKTLGAILSFANSKALNVFVCITLYGIHLGRYLCAFECAALVNGIPSCFELILHQTENDDLELEFVDDVGDVWDTDMVVEVLQDGCINNFAKDPYELDGEGYLTDRGEEQREKVDKIIANAVFPSIYEI